MWSVRILFEQTSYTIPWKKTQLYVLHSLCQAQVSCIGFPILRTNIIYGANPTVFNGVRYGRSKNYTQYVDTIMEVYP